MLDELEGRALAALNSIPHAATRFEADRQREPLRNKLEESLGFGRAVGGFSSSALVYAPIKLDRPAPAIVVVRPHEDPEAKEPQALARSLAALGFIVVSLDLRTSDSAVNLLPNGITPEGLSQRAIRDALAYLLSRKDVDHAHLGIMGSALKVLVAAAINPEFAAVVLSDPAPDFRERIRSIRGGGEKPSSLDGLIPGMLQYAATEELFAMIAPRPLLAVSPAGSVYQYATGIYAAFGASPNLRELTDTGSMERDRQAMFAWFARWLQDRPEVALQPEPGASIQAASVRFPGVKLREQAGKRFVAKEQLTSLLGSPLPESKMGYGLSCAQQQEIAVKTEPTIDIPVTVFRPGPKGCDVEKGVLVALDDEGRHTFESDEIVQEEVRRGWMVWAIDPRGIGELKTDNEDFVFAVSLLLGENLVWRQASDISRIVALVSSNPSHHIAMYARGKDAGLAAAYVAASAESSTLPEWIVLRDAVTTFSTATNVQPHFWPFDALSAFDIPDLISAAKPRVVLVTRPGEVLEADWSW